MAEKATGSTDGAARLPKYMELRELIRQKIQSGQLGPGSAIQTEPELAKRHNVSVSTVKEALKDLVKEGLITRVRGRGTFVNSDVNRGQGMLPVLTPVLGDRVTHGFYLGFEERSAALGQSSVLWSTRQVLEGATEDWNRHPVLRDIEALAIIAAGAGRQAQEQDRRVIRSLLDAGKKLVVVDQHLPDLEGDTSNLLYLGSNNVDPMREIGRGLAQARRERIGFIGFHEGGYTQEQRHAGLILGVLEAGGDPPLEPMLLDKAVLEHFRSESNEASRVTRDAILAYAARCDAICAANDMLAALVLRALPTKKIRVPEDCAVTGFDDSDISATTNPPLTTVRQPLHRMGESAVDLLLALRDGVLRGPARWTLDAEVVLRASTGEVE